MATASIRMATYMPSVVSKGDSDSKLKIVINSLGRDFTGDIRDKPYQVVFRPGFT